MPKNKVETDAALAEADAGVADARQAEIAMGIPPAEEELEPAALNALADTLKGALKTLTNGEMPPPAIPEYTETMGQVPPELGKLVLGLEAMLSKYGESQPALAPYAFNAGELLTTNDGLTELAALIDSMASDPDVKEALSQPAEPLEDEAAEEPADEMAEDVPAPEDFDTEEE